MPDSTIGDHDVELFARRVIVDALLEAASSYWRHRADQLEQCLSQPGDHPGRRTAEQQARADQQVRAAVFACRARAALIDLQGDARLAAEADEMLAAVVP